MGIYPQPNLWQCGPFALKHALIMLGIFLDEKRIARVAGSSPSSGTNEYQLRRAAHHFDCAFPVLRREEPERARRALSAYLRRGVPCLICINEWAHWVTVVKYERGSFIVLDSRDRAVLTIWTWPQLRRRWGYHLADEDHPRGRRILFDFHPVLPQYRVQARAKLSLARAEFLREPRNRALVRRWDEYVTDLLALARVRTPLSENVLSMGEFLRRHEGLILEQVDFWHGSLDRDQAATILKHLHFVADTFGMVIHEREQKRVIAGLTAILTLWAANRFGVRPVYAGKAPRRRRP